MAVDRLAKEPLQHEANGDPGEVRGEQIEGGDKDRDGRRDDHRPASAKAIGEPAPETLRQKCREVCQCEPDILFLGMGTPMKERFADKHGAELGARVIQGVGGSFDVMAGLESLAGRLACEAITDEEIAAIERLHYEMYGHYLNSDMHGYFQVNQRIHESIVAAARNETLRAAYASFAGRIRRVRYSANFARQRQRWGEAMREHEAILDALRRRAGSELSDILFQHLRNKRTAAIEHLAAARGATATATGS